MFTLDRAMKTIVVAASSCTSVVKNPNKHSVHPFDKPSFRVIAVHFCHRIPFVSFHCDSSTADESGIPQHTAHIIANSTEFLWIPRRCQRKQSKDHYIWWFQCQITTVFVSVVSRCSMLNISFKFMFRKIACFASCWCHRRTLTRINPALCTQVITYSLNMIYIFYPDFTNDDSDRFTHCLL